MMTGPNSSSDGVNNNSRQPQLYEGSSNSGGTNSRFSMSSPYTGPRSQMLQNLAKKISQKNRKISSSLNTMRASGLHQRTAPLISNKRAGAVTSEGGGGMNSSNSSSAKVCSSCGHANPQYKKRCGMCNEFIVGTACSVCSALNYYRAKVCVKCGADMPFIWGGGNTPNTNPAVGMATDKSHDHRHHHQQGEVPGSEASDSSSPSTSPVSPKFSAPPIRSAVLKSLFPQVK